MNTALRLTIKQWATEDRPTERLQRLGAESLTDAELLAILIGSGTQQFSAVDIGNQVLGRFNHRSAFRTLCLQRTSTHWARLVSMKYSTSRESAHRQPARYSQP